MNFETKVLTIIPAAGKGSRVNLRVPKILIKIKNQRIIDILIQKVSNVSKNFVFVVSPKHKEKIKKYLSDHYKNKIKYNIVTQNKPLGMGNAVLKANKFSKKFQKILIIWGDHIGVSKTSINKINKIKFKNNTCILPLVKIRNPYVQYIFKNNNLQTILESREGDISSNIGYSDIGTFLFHSKNLPKYLNAFKKTNNRGSITKEQNFLPFFIFLKRKKWNIKKIIFKNSLQTKGVNTKDDIKSFNR